MKTQALFLNSTRFAVAMLMLLALSMAHAGIFPPAAGQPGSQAVFATDSDIDGWADAVEVYNPGLEVDAGFRTPLKALGEAGNSDGAGQGYTFDIVSLGRGGSITLAFSPPITNGAGFDFAVYENSFDDDFLELAKVEVSSDGQIFVAFPAMSTVPAAVSAFGSVDPTDIEQVAGKYRGGFGTPFDLARLSGAPGLDVSSVRYVRLTDVIGDGTTNNDLTPQVLADWLGLTVAELPQVLIDIANSSPAAMYDPYPTFESAGFDLDAVAVLEQGPVPASIDIDPFNTGPIDPDSTALIPVLVYSSSLVAGDLDEFDATAIDTSSVEFAYYDAAPVAAPVSWDFDGDGLVDTGLQFQTQDTGIACEDTEADLTGMTIDGLAFTAVAAIVTPACTTNTCHP